MFRFPGISAGRDDADGGDAPTTLPARKGKYPVRGDPITLTKYLHNGKQEREDVKDVGMFKCVRKP